MNCVSLKALCCNESLSVMDQDLLEMVRTPACEDMVRKKILSTFQKEGPHQNQP